MLKTIYEKALEKSQAIEIQPQTPPKVRSRTGEQGHRLRQKDSLVNEPKRSDGQDEGTLQSSHPRPRDQRNLFITSVQVLR